MYSIRENVKKIIYVYKKVKPPSHVLDIDLNWKINIRFEEKNLCRTRSTQAISTFLTLTNFLLATLDTSINNNNTQDNITSVIPGQTLFCIFADLQVAMVDLVLSRTLPNQLSSSSHNPHHSVQHGPAHTDRYIALQYSTV